MGTNHLLGKLYCSCIVTKKGFQREIRFDYVMNTFQQKKLEKDNDGKRNLTIHFHYMSSLHNSINLLSFTQVIRNYQ